MPNSKNRGSIKGSDQESRTGKASENSANRKLPDNPDNAPDESISTAGDTSNGIYSKTNKRKEDIDKDETRGGK